jgi:chemotaxis protein CheZ
MPDDQPGRTRSPLAPADAAEGPRPASEIDAGAGRHRELMLEIRALRSAIEARGRDAAAVERPAHFGEIHKLKREFDLIHGAIEGTKLEIATLQNGFRGRAMRRIAHELDAIVGDTEAATEQILNAAEAIDGSAKVLRDRLRTEEERKLMSDVQERVVEIFESCNFQDIAGQRIAKVVTTLEFIEDRIVNMMAMWGKIDALRDFTAMAMGGRSADGQLLDGPRLEADAEHASQDDIDALFN